MQHTTCADIRYRAVSLQNSYAKPQASTDCIWKSSLFKIIKVEWKNMNGPLIQ